MDSTDDPAWKALREHGRAGVGRPRKDSKSPTLAQLGLTKWIARKSQFLAALSPEEFERVAKRQGPSVTALLERRSRAGRRRNPLFRAWRVSMKHEREEFIEALRLVAFFEERETDLKDIK